MFAFPGSRRKGAGLNLIADIKGKAFDICQIWEEQGQTIRSSQYLILGTPWKEPAEDLKIYRRH